MVRIVKEYDERRTEILDTAQRFFYQKGYEQTSIQALIKAVGIAKGTFYHYFGSKQELLDEMIERMLAQQLQTLRPVVENEQIDAITKFNRLFNDLHNWKIENKAFFLDALRTLYQDENLLLRHKLRAASVAQIVPFLTAVIKQGLAEGVFDTQYPADMGEIVMRMGEVLGETVAEMLLEEDRDYDLVPVLAQKVAAYERAVERALGAPAGSLKLLAIDHLTQWFE